MPQASSGSTITSTNQILDGIIINADINAAAAIAYSKLNLALSIVNGDIAANAAIALSKFAAGTQGDVLIATAAGVWTSLVAGTSGQFLKTNGAGADPTWGAAAAKSIISVGKYVGYSLPDATSFYFIPGGVDAPQTSAPEFGMVLPFACTIKNLTAQFAKAANNPGTQTVTVYKNGVATTLSVAVTNGSHRTTDSTHTITCAALDDLFIRVANTAGFTDTFGFDSIVFELDPS